METKNKKEYIRRWQEHAKDFNTLRFCSDENLSKEVKETIDKLNELIVKIADTKNLR